MKEKKKIILLGVAIIIISFLAIVWVMNIPEEDLSYGTFDIEEYYWSEDPKNYTFEEKGDFILVKNDNLGFSFEIPTDWEYELEYHKEDDGGGLVLYSPEYVPLGDYREFSPKKGCLTGFYVFEEYYKDEEGVIHYDADNLRTKIEMLINEEIIRDSYSIIKIDNYYGYSTKNIGNDLGVDYIRTPIENKIYEITGHFSGQDIEKCQKDYQNLLESISFPKNES